MTRNISVHLTIGLAAGGRGEKGFNLKSTDNLCRGRNGNLFAGHVAILGMMCSDYVQLEISYET